MQQFADERMNGRGDGRISCEDGWADNWQAPDSLPAGRDMGAVLPGRLPWLESVAGAESARKRVPPRRSCGPAEADHLPGLLHDSRNMVSAIDLYCDLLEEQGVLATPFGHYAQELRLVAGASRRLMERMEKLVQWEVSAFHATGTAYAPSLSRPGRGRELLASQPIESFAEELLASRSLLSALAGPAVTVGFTLAGGYRPLAISADDLTRVLVNLVRNAAEAMPAGGHIQLAVVENVRHIRLTVTDNGPGISRDALETIFSPGYSSHVSLRREFDAGDAPGDGNAGGVYSESTADAWPIRHRGLGLSIVRALVTAAGGTIWATNQQDSPGATGQPISSELAPKSGAVFVLEFPIQRLAKP